jgi:uncharacterized protein YigE (DUF2233 family)
MVRVAQFILDVRSLRAALVISAVLVFDFATHSQSASAQPPPCRTLSFEQNSYTICEVDLRKQAIRLFWRRSDGSPYARLSALPQTDGPTRGKLLFAVNAGMFDPDLKPVGLYIEDGRELVRANTRSGFGNFHLKPNGVFYVAGGSAGVLETSAYLHQRPKADLATQSGPMLVINGRLHPRFDAKSTSLKPRNGVGVRDEHTVVFAISNGEVPFAAFARLFKNGLSCSNALFLDGGTASHLYAPLMGRGSNLISLGPMLGVFER